ncbi:hypothetical protein TNIN_265761 [Trichonephila inaurata madagascariensis]|uniref:Uncharacterized protein n=1 Tax=Trichonephila inaurata madagascariensis TaxID=2747483 RepID=A0A8X6YTQ6_9ARAC|nr:hypothetical protein TNIN_265761 [Trichonephila inaurata madagascariensis]
MDRVYTLALGNCVVEMNSVALGNCVVVMNSVALADCEALGNLVALADCGEGERVSLPFPFGKRVGRFGCHLHFGATKDGTGRRWVEGDRSSGSGEYKLGKSSDSVARWAVLCPTGRKLPRCAAYEPENLMVDQVVPLF